MAGLIQELKRRNVFRVGMAYLALAWLVMQVTEMAVPALNLPESLNSIVFYIGLVGFPFALFFAWAFELTPEGIKPENQVTAEESITPATGQRLTHFTIIALALLLVFVVLDQYVLEERAIPAPVATTKPAASQAASAPEAKQELSIAVLPFRNRSSVEEDSYFVDGIHDDILTLLTRVSAFSKVISRTSVERYRDTERPIPEIASELGVTTILEGGVQRAGNRVRINMQLIDSATDEHLWAETYDRELTIDNLFDIQTEVAEAIVAALRASLSPEEKQQLGKKSTSSLEAMEQYFLGKQLARREAEGDHAAALAHFNKALELDPNFALGWTALSRYYMGTSFNNNQLRDPYITKSYKAINRALALDPDLGEAYLALGINHLVVDDLQEAELALERARTLIPNSPELYATFSSLHFAKGNLQEAARYQALAIERGGQAMNFGYGDPLLFLGRFDEAEQNYLEMMEVMPGSPRGYWGMAASKWLRGDLPVAVHWARQAFALNQYFVRVPQLHFAYTHLLWDLHADEEAACVARIHYSQQSDGFVEHEQLMLVHMVLGNREQSLKYALAAKELMINNAMQLGPRQYTLTFLRDEALREGDVTEVRALYETTFPQLFSPRLPAMHVGLLYPAVDLLPILRVNGEDALANMLLGAAMKFIEDNPTVGILALADLLTMQGEYDGAIAALKTFSDLGGFYSRFAIEFNTNLTPLHDLPAYQELLESNRARAQAQLKELRATEDPATTCQALYPENK